MADIISLFHCLWAISIPFAGFLVRRWAFWWWYLFPNIIAFGFARLVFFPLCPLTVMEDMIRTPKMGTSHSDTFFQYYMEEWFRVQVSPEMIAVVLVVSLLISIWITAIFAGVLRKMGERIQETLEERF